MLTDHGDGTRRPEAPAYRAGVLVIDGVEVSTRGGHYVAIALPQSPYPLAGDAADVVEDVRRMGGFGIVAHPDSPKAELRWTEWSAPFDAVELINPDTSWRIHASQGGLAGKWLLWRSLLAYPARPVEAQPARIVSLKANLIFKSNPLSLKQLLPYQESLVAYIYEVQEVVEGQYKDRQVLVMHPAHMALRSQSLAGYRVGKSYLLRLQELEGSSWNTVKSKDDSDSLELLPYIRVEDELKFPGGAR